HVGIYLNSWAGSINLSDRSAASPARSAITSVATDADTNNSHGSSTLVPNRSARAARANVAGSASAMPTAPTQNDCDTTAPAMRQREMPSASSTANSRRAAATAE